MRQLLPLAQFSAAKSLCAIATSPPQQLESRRYIEMVRELEQQIAGQGFTDLVMVRFVLHALD